MKVTCTFFEFLLIQFIGRCSSVRVLSITDFPEIRVENVQLIELIDGESVELQQQDFGELYAMRTEIEFIDDQFPEELFPLSQNERVIRAKELAKNPVLFIEKFFHVKQGILGDCWFLAGLINLQFHENLFKFIVQQDEQSFEDDKYAGIFHFRFWQGGTWVDVVVDDRLPTNNGKLVYASSGNDNEFWPALIEKAYAKLLFRSYTKLDAGYASIAMQDLSGGISETYFVKNSESRLFKMIQDTIQKSSMITCSTYSAESEITTRVEIDTFEINLDHAYALTALKILKKDNVDDEIKLIRIRNPHGVALLNRYPGKIKEIFPKETIESELKIEVDGESWILFEDFIKFFISIYICNLTPNILTGHIFSRKSGNKLLLSAIKGKWMGGVTSREVIANDFLKINPQYRMVLKNSNEGDKCHVLIGLSLNSKHDSTSTKDELISFQIIKYDNNEGEILTKPLLGFSKKPIAFGPNGNRARVSERFDLEPGTYYILPFIKNSFKAATFYLQILSEQKDILEVYDRNIQMPNVKFKIQTLESEYIKTTDYQIFFDMLSIEDSANNFKGLYNILKNNSFSLNENCNIKHHLDDGIILELDTLLRAKKYVQKKKLSVAKIAEIRLNIEEAFEFYQQPNFPGYIDISFIIILLRKNGYSMNNELLKRVVLHNVEKKDLIHLNDLSLIVFTFKSKFGSTCEEFNPKLCRDLIAMIHFRKSEDSDLRISTQQFKMIIQFLTKLKKIFYYYASTSYRSLSFTKFKDTLDAIGYYLTYDIIATIFHKHGNDDDIFFHQFLQAVVDVTMIFEKIQTVPLNRDSINFDELYHNMFHQAWKKI